MCLESLSSNVWAYLEHTGTQKKAQKQKVEPAKSYLHGLSNRGVAQSASAQRSGR